MPGTARRERNHPWGDKKGRFADAFREDITQLLSDWWKGGEGVQTHSKSVKIFVSPTKRIKLSNACLKEGGEGMKSIPEVLRKCCCRPTHTKGTSQCFKRGWHGGEACLRNFWTI